MTVTTLVQVTPNPDSTTIISTGTSTTVVATGTIGPPGPAGAPGVPGPPGADGADGVDGSDGFVTFKCKIWKNASDYTTTSIPFVDIDSTNLGFLTLNLSVGDVVELSLSLGLGNSGGEGSPVKIDWLIDRPTSGDTTIRDSYGGFGAAMLEAFNYGIAHQTINALFICTEAGVHGFKPQWRVNSGTAKIDQTDVNYAAPIFHKVVNLGQPAA